MSTPADRSSQAPWITRVYRFYLDGFKGMSRHGRTLWAIILIKLFIMFAILRVFFFPNYLAQKGDNTAKADYVADQLYLEEEAAN